MVKVFYGCKMNAFLGDVFFSEGIAEFDKDKEGIEFANRYYLKYEVIEAIAEKEEKTVATKTAKTAKKKVKKNE